MTNDTPPVSIRHALLGLLLLVCWALAAPVCAGIVLGMFSNINHDTTVLSNAAIAVLGLMANLSFSYARAIENDVPIRARVVRIGEDFFLAALIFAAASLLKYATLQMKAGTWPVSQEVREEWVALVSYLSGGCFAVAGLIAYIGVFLLSILLIQQRQQRPSA